MTVIAACVCRGSGLCVVQRRPSRSHAWDTASEPNLLTGLVLSPTQPPQGGLYAPSIFIGAALGTAFGLMAHAVGDPLGMTLAAPQAYALVGECLVRGALGLCHVDALLLLLLVCVAAARSQLQSRILSPLLQARPPSWPPTSPCRFLYALA